MIRYEMPRTPSRLLGELRFPERRRPRGFPEWKALLQWQRLPAPETRVVGYRLRLLREDAGLSQTELGQRLGITQQAVSRAERWQANPTVSFLRRWAEACGAELQLDFLSTELSPSR